MKGGGIMSKTLWTISFKSNNQDFGSGVITLDGDQIYGGDVGYYYLGKFVTTGNSISASATITKHNPSVVSIFGNFTSFKLALTGNGSISDGHFSLSGHVEEYPQMTMTATMRKLVNLA
jgi:hypothetical protein